MKIPLPLCLVRLALLAVATSSALADTRMQVSVPSTPVYTQPSAGAQQMGKASSGEILFVSRVEGEWAAISPPDRLSVWLNKDFIEGNRVIAKSIQVRSGPGVHYDVVGTLERGAPVMPRGEEGDWSQIAPPSSAVLWVQRSALSEILARTTPIREVAPAPQPSPPPAPAATPSPPPETASVPPRPAPAVSPRPPEPAPAPAPTPSPSAPPAPVKVAPSTPHAPAPSPVQRPAPAPAPVPHRTAAIPSSPMPVTAAPARPVTETPPAAQPPPAPPPPAAAAKPAAPTLRPATALPGPSAASPTPQPAAQPTLPPTAQPAAPRAAGRRPPDMPAVSKAVPAPAGAVVAQKSKDVDVNVKQSLVDDLALDDSLPNQGKAVQVEGELRNAPFMAASPSRYRLVDQDENGRLEMVCHIHGDPQELRRLVGKKISVRGREFWVENSDMPVVVVGQIVPLAPSDEDEPVMF